MANQITDVMIDPYITISWLDENDNKNHIYHSEVINNTLNPEWKPFDLTVNDLTVGDMHARLLVECFDHDLVGSSDLIGVFKVSNSLHLIT